MGQGRGSGGRGRPGRHDVAVAVRRPSSSCVQGSATRGGVEKLQRGTGVEWDGGAASGRWRRRPAQNRGGREKRESRERKKEI